MKPQVFPPHIALLIRATEKITGREIADALADDLLLEQREALANTELWDASRETWLISKDLTLAIESDGSFLSLSARYVLKNDTRYFVAMIDSPTLGRIRQRSSSRICAIARARVIQKKLAEVQYLATEQDLRDMGPLPATRRMFLEKAVA